MPPRPQVSDEWVVLQGAVATAAALLLVLLPVSVCLYVTCLLHITQTHPPFELLVKVTSRVEVVRVILELTLWRQQVDTILRMSFSGIATLLPMPSR